MDTNLPSLARTRFHSLNRHNNSNSNNRRGHHTNNLDLDPSTSPGLYCTLAHPRPHVRLMPAPETRPEPVYCGSSREEGAYNVSSTSDYNTISVSASDESGSCDQQTQQLLRVPSVRRAALLSRLWRAGRLCAAGATLASPLLMLCLPHLELVPLHHHQLRCGLGCEGTKISILLKLLLLAVSAWALPSLSQPSTSGPRPDPARVLVTLLLGLLLVTSWTLYLTQLVSSSAQLQYEQLVEGVAGLVSCLLALHYLSVLLLLLLDTAGPAGAGQLLVHVVRAEDGASCHVGVGPGCGGHVTLQSAARAACQQYYTTFTAVPAPADKQTKYKQLLIKATEDSWAKISCSAGGQQAAAAGWEGSADVARAVFPAIYRQLSRYLKAAWAGRGPDMDTILASLTTYIQHGMSPQAFLSQYLNPASVLQVTYLLELAGNEA